MDVLVLNGSPRPEGSVSKMVSAFKEGAEEAGHTVAVLAVAHMDIAGCRACEWCHTRGEGACIQKDDMEQVYARWNEADVIVLASPVYFYVFSGQLQCALHRTYAPGNPARAKKAALILSAGSDCFDTAVAQYRKTFGWAKVPDAGIVTAFGDARGSEEKLEEARDLGRSL